MFFLKMIFASFTIVLAATSSNCSNWFQVKEESDYPKTLTAESVTGTQTDVLKPKFEALESESKLNDFLNAMPSRTNRDATLPSFDADNESRVGVISVSKSCEFNPVLQDVVETKDVVQVKILNEKITQTNCTPEITESYRYFIIVFDKKNKPITILTEDKV